MSRFVRYFGSISRFERLVQPCLDLLGGQNVDLGWVKYGKEGYFHTSHLTPNPVSSKKEVLKRHNLLSH